MTYIPRQDDGPAAMERAKDALQFIDAHDRETWVLMAMALKSEFGEAGFAIWNEWSQSAENYNQHDAMIVWNGIKAGGGVGIGSLYHLAMENGWRDDVTYTAETMTPEQVEQRRQARMQAAAQAAGRSPNARAPHGHPRSARQPCTAPDHPPRNPSKPPSSLAARPAPRSLFNTPPCSRWPSSPS